MKPGVFAVRFGEAVQRVRVSADGTVEVEGVDGSLTVVPEGPGVYRVDDGRLSRRVFVVGTNDDRQVFVDGEVYDLHTGPPAREGTRAGRPSANILLAPMPAKVTAVLVEPGAPVRKGDVLIKLEAMKMELPIRSPRDGSVASLSCREGDLVQPGVVLLELS